jgi:hypothetical protein
MALATTNVQVVCQGDEMACSDLVHFVLAVAIERRPLDRRLWVARCTLPLLASHDSRPVEYDLFAEVMDSEGTT